MAASADELKLPLKAGITMAYDVLIDLALYSMFSRIGKADLPASEVDKFLAVLPKTDSYAWNPAVRIKDNFNSFLGQEGKTEGVITAAGSDYEAAIKDQFKTVLKYTEGLVKSYKDRSFFKSKLLAVLELVYQEMADALAQL